MLVVTLLYPRTDDSTFDMDTTPDAKQRQALDLLKTISL